MAEKHVNLFIPQWQGGDDLSTYNGGIDIKDKYFEGIDLVEIPVSTQAASREKNGIVGYEDICIQTEAALETVIRLSPNTLFTVGGGCDADIVPLSYSNYIHEGDVAVVYFDSHGDIHSPRSSPSKLFYGMPVRTLLGDGDETLVNMLPSKLESSQLIYVGVRDLDQPEEAFIEKAGITTLSSETVEADVGSIACAIREKGFNHVYIHIDLDVLEPAEFPYVPLPVPSGLSVAAFAETLDLLVKEFDVIGLGLFEYMPTRGKIELLQRIVTIGDTLIRQ